LLKSARAGNLASVSESNSPNQSDTLRLVALGAAAPQILELRDSRVKVGAGAGNDLTLNEPTASRRHAALERRDGRWYVVDLASTNGTYINGRRVTVPSPLARGDELRFGDARFGFVAPGDDLSKVGPGSAKAAARSRRRVPRRASAIAALLLFAGGGFALTAYLLRLERRDRAAGAAQSAATAPAARARPPLPLRPRGSRGSTTIALSRTCRRLPRTPRLARATPCMPAIW
jgi:hypothetical protein